MQIDKNDDGGLLVPGTDSGGDESRSDVGGYGPLVIRDNCRNPDPEDTGRYGPLALANILHESEFHMAFAFDPGDSTGVCGLGRSAIYKLQTEDQAGLFGALGCTTFGIPRGVVFYEGFVSRPAQFSRTQIAPQNIGAIKLWAYLNGFKAVEVQPAQTHRIKREDVKFAGWEWNTEHEFDAIRILIHGLLSLRHR